MVGLPRGALLANIPSCSRHLFYLIMPVTLYIALYTRREPGVVGSSFHWVLVAGNTGDKRRHNDSEEKSGGDDRVPALLNAYQIVNNREDSNEWFIQHHPQIDPKALNPETFVGYVRLGPLSTDIGNLAEFEEWMQSWPADQGDSPSLGTHRRWSCAQWALRVLDALKESDTLVIKPDLAGEPFYCRVLAKGMVLENVRFSDFTAGSVPVVDF